MNTKKILFSLQIANDFEENFYLLYIEIVQTLIAKNANFLSSHNYEVIFKHHPRFSKDHCLDLNLEYDFTYFDNHRSMEDLLSIVDIHITFNSTSIFDASMMGVPSILIDMHEQMSPYEIFINQYEYPCKNLILKNYKALENILIESTNNDLYSKYSNEVYTWYKQHYNGFDEIAFKNFLLNKIK